MLRTCFQGVHRDGEVIRVRDTVLLRSGPRKKTLPFVAKISALWQDPESGRRPAPSRSTEPRAALNPTRRTEPPVVNPCQKY